MIILLMLLGLVFWASFVALFWTYFGYPLLMWGRARWQKLPSVVDADNRPAVTLLIPVHNEADVIRRKLENTLTIEYPVDRWQVLVVDDGSSDETTAIVAEYEEQGVTLLRQPVRSGKMNAVNAGLAAASGDIVILSDASPSYDVHAIKLLVQHFSDPQIGVVVGTLAVWDAENAVAKSAGLYWKYEAALRRWESQTGSTVAVHGNMFALRREQYQPLQTGTINDEFSIAMEMMRQGYRVIYEPAALSYDDASATMGDEFNRRVRINAGRYQALFSAGYLKTPTFDLAFRLFSHKLLRPLTPVFMFFVLLSNVLLCGATGSWFWWLALAGQSVFYLLAGAGWLAERQGRRARYLNIPYFFVSSNLAALLGLWRWVWGTQRVTWQKRTSEHENAAN
ncbi:glycosyltransferase family 2 protein [Chloroflexota bacterium]